MSTRKRPLAILIVLISLIAQPPSISAQLLGAIGGVEGVGEEATVTPLLTMTGEANLREGTGVVGVGFVYARFTRLFGEDIEDPSDEFNIQTEDFNRALEATSRILLLGYGVTDRLNIGAGVPFAEIRSRLPETSTGPAVEQELDGIGNVALAAKYQFFSSPHLAFRLTAQLPSGYEVGADYLQLAADVAYSVRVDQTSFHLQAGYLWTDVDRQNQDRLDTAVANLAVARSIGDRFVAVLELNYQYLVGADDLKDSAYFDSPAQMSLDLTPGIKVQIKDNLTFASAVRIALINTVSFGYDTAYIFLVGYSF